MRLEKVRGEGVGKVVVWGREFMKVNIKGEVGHRSGNRTGEVGMVVKE